MVESFVFGGSTTRGARSPTQTSITEYQDTATYTHRASRVLVMAPVHHISTPVTPEFHRFRREQDRYDRCAMKPSTDLLADYSHGYDGVLERVETHLREPHGDTHLSVVVVLRVVDTRGRWARLELKFRRITEVRIDGAWFVGGGGVLYNGGRLFVTADRTHALLDLDPGVAWLVDPPKDHSSTFRIAGELGAVEFSPL
jgi:hypothetical protein